MTRTAVCPECGERVKVNPEELLYAHGGEGRYRCPGSKTRNLEPKGGSVRAYLGGQPGSGKKRK